MKNKIVKLIVVVACVISCSFSVVALFSGCSTNNYKFLVINSLKKENIIKSNWVLEDEYSESWNWDSSRYFFIYKDEDGIEYLISMSPNISEESIKEEYGYDSYYNACLITNINYNKYAEGDEKETFNDDSIKYSYYLLCNNINKIEKVVEHDSYYINDRY